MAFATVHIHRSSFTQIPNAAMLKMLRANQVRAFGLYVYMASTPEDWIFHPPVMAKTLNWSVSTIERAMRDLEETGYMSRKVVKDSKGKFHHMAYDVYYDPMENTEEIVHRELEIPPDYVDLCEKKHTIRAVYYALSMLDEKDRQFLFDLQDLSRNAYNQVLLHTINAVEEHQLMNPEGYAMSVLANEIKRTRREYGCLMKGN